MLNDQDTANKVKEDRTDIPNIGGADIKKTDKANISDTNKADIKEAKKVGAADVEEADRVKAEFPSIVIKDPGTEDNP